MNLPAPLNLLAIDCCMQACSAAVLVTRNGGGGNEAPQIFELYEEISRGHAERLMPMIDEALNEAGLGIKDIDRLAVTTGPGSFTGVRIGVATARGLALALDLPLVSANSLQVMAADYQHNCPQKPDDLLAVAIDARRGQVYVQLFEQSGAPGWPEPQAIHPEQIGQLLPAERNILLVGSGSELISEALAGQTGKTGQNGNRIELTGYRQDNPQPRARYLATLALDLPVCKIPPEPLYLRPPDAKIQSGYAIERQ